MHKLTTVLVLTLLPLFGLSQNTVSGKIVDELGLPIYMASIEINETDEVVYTDYEGDFILVCDKHFHWKIKISSTGYKPETYFVLDGGQTNALVLEFDEDMNNLLKDNSKSLEQTYGYLFKKY